MATKAKSFEKNIKNVEELVQNSPDLKGKIDPKILKSIPKELLEDVSKTTSKFLGGDGLANYLKEFMGIFKTISDNTEMNTAGVSALAKNMKYLRSDIKNLQDSFNELNNKFEILIENLGELNAK